MNTFDFCGQDNQEFADSDLNSEELNQNEKEKIEKDLEYFFTLNYLTGTSFPHGCFIKKIVAERQISLLVFSFSVDLTNRDLEKFTNYGN